ncbi:MAG: hypothetical protein M3072_00790 [Candidatus Dormibacteraeota bacterium]|nr:hypothetical protein [Candidatus Dormibacteraeota bacterium]
MIDPGGILNALHQLQDTVNGIKDSVTAIGDALNFLASIERFIKSTAQDVAHAAATYVFITADPYDPKHTFVETEAISKWLPLTKSVANGALTVALTWGFFRVMFAHGMHSQHGLRQMLPRAMLAAVLINFSTVLIQAGVEATNAMNLVVLKANQADHFQLLVGWLLPVSQPSDLTAPAWNLLARLALVLSYGLLAIVYIVRFTVLVILTVLAPLAALSFVLPETSHYAKQWGHLFSLTLLMQPLQLLILEIGITLDVTWQKLPLFPVQHLFALAAVYICFKVPGALGMSTKVFGKAGAEAKKDADHAWKAAVKVLAK